MKIKRITSLVIVAIGLLLLVGAPLVPGGERLIPKDPPRTGHVTDLARADDGSILAGTQDGELWQFTDGLWRPVAVDLGGHPVTALSADLSGNPALGPIGTGGGLYNVPSGLPDLSERVADEAMTVQGLVVATGDGLHIAGDGTWRRALEGTYVYRLEPQSSDGRDFLHGGTIGQGVVTAEIGSLLDWKPNAEGLPAGANVFSFVISADNRLIAGTDRGLYWQPAPFAGWKLLGTGLESRRVLSLYLAPPRDSGAQRLWIGSDEGLWRVDLAETEDRLKPLTEAEPIEATTETLEYGVSWIVRSGGGVMFSSGGVYWYGPTGLRGWIWISIAGFVLILVGGYLFPARPGSPQSGKD